MRCHSKRFRGVRSAGRSTNPFFPFAPAVATPNVVRTTSYVLRRSRSSVRVVPYQQRTFSGREDREVISPYHWPSREVGTMINVAFIGMRVEGDADAAAAAAEEDD